MYKREIELSGHIIDSLTLPKTMDIIMDNVAMLKLWFQLNLPIF